MSAVARRADSKIGKLRALLDARLLLDLLRAALEALLLEPLEAVQKREEAEREIIRRLLEGEP